MCALVDDAVVLTSLLLLLFVRFVHLVLLVLFVSPNGVTPTQVRTTEAEEDADGAPKRPPSATEADVGTLHMAQSTLTTFLTRQTRLGSAYGKRTRSWHNDRVTQRVVEPKRPEIHDTDKIAQGLLICNPFSILALSHEATLPAPRREPSCLARNRKKPKPWQESRGGGGGAPVKGKHKHKHVGTLPDLRGKSRIGVVGLLVTP